jgi:hypothetical protein
VPSLVEQVLATVPAQARVAALVPAICDAALIDCAFLVQRLVAAPASEQVKLARLDTGRCIQYLQATKAYAAQLVATGQGDRKILEDDRLRPLLVKIVEPTSRLSPVDGRPVFTPVIDWPRHVGVTLSAAILAEIEKGTYLDAVKETAQEYLADLERRASGAYDAAVAKATSAATVALVVGGGLLAAVVGVSLVWASSRGRDG